MAQDIIKNIPLTLDINARKRLDGTVDISLYSKDIATGQFEFTFIDEDGDPVVLDEAYSAQALVRYNDEEKTYLNDMIIEGNIIRFIFPHDFITKDGIVTMYIYITKDNYTSDVAAISFNVYRSEIDDIATDIVTTYDKNYEDILAEFEQALVDYKSTLPKADSVRADIDEILNQFSEDSQAKLSQYDADAQQAIADNQTAFDLAETGRQNTYEQAETDRNQLSNQAVVDWEQGADALLETVEGNESVRVDAEETRKTSETDRISSESTRKTNETTRINNENARKSAEGNRQSTFEANEVGRQSEFEENEQGRESAEAVRVSNEEERELNEAERISKDSERDSKIEEIEGLQTDLASSVFIHVTNLIENGNFKDPNNDGVADSFVMGNKITDFRVENNTQYWTSSELLWASALRTSTSIALPIKESNNYYISMVSQNINQVLYEDAIIYASSLNPLNGKTSHIFTATKSVKYLQFRGLGECSVSYLMLIDLTETFGAGNEPTQEEMDELIKVTGYIDGEYALNNKEMLSHLMKGIREKADKNQEEWITPTLLNDFTGDVRYRKTDFGHLEIYGTITSAEPITPALHTVFLLPSGYRPTRDVKFEAPEDTFYTFRNARISYTSYDKAIIISAGQGGSKWDINVSIPIN